MNSFEQPTHRPTQGQKRCYSGKKKRHTLKSQVAGDEASEEVVSCHPACPGRRRT